MQAEGPDPSKIPESEIVGVAVLLLKCRYMEQEFINIGWFVATEYTDPELQEEPPATPVLEKVLILFSFKVVFFVNEIPKHIIMRSTAKISDKKKAFVKHIKQQLQKRPNPTKKKNCSIENSLYFTNDLRLVLKCFGLFAVAKKSLY